MELNNYISSGVLELFVAGALSEEENRDVLEMIKKHPLIEKEVEAIESNVLALLEVPVLSKDHLDKTLNRVRSSRQAAESNIAIQDSSKNPSVSAKPETKTSSLWTWLAAASIVLLVGSVLTNVYFMQQLREAQSKIASLENEKLVLAQNNQSLQTKYQEKEEQFAAVSGSGTKKVELAGQAASPDSKAIVYWNAERQQVMVDIRQLPKPPPGKVYQLWSLKMDPLTPTDAGVLAYDEDNFLVSAKKVGSAEAFAITLEPAGGSVNPNLEQLYVLGTI